MNKALFPKLVLERKSIQLLVSGPEWTTLLCGGNFADYCTPVPLMVSWQTLIVARYSLRNLGMRRPRSEVLTSIEGRHLACLLTG